MIFAKPTDEVLYHLKQYNIIELGAGNGYWIDAINAYGGNAIGLDLYPTSPSVKEGDENSLQNYTDRNLLLVVWPPSEVDLRNWFKHWKFKVAVCGSVNRMICPPILTTFQTILEGEYRGNTQSLFRIGNPLL